MTKTQRYLAFYHLYRTVKDGKKPNFARDGSIATKPVVDCADIPEAKVLQECRSWLAKRCILVDRLNSGCMPNEKGQMFAYGIKGAGDLIVCFRGLHIEIECKRGHGGRLSLNQQGRKQKVEWAGGVFLVVHGVGELELLWQREVLSRFGE